MANKVLWIAETDDLGATSSPLVASTDPRLIRDVLRLMRQRVCEDGAGDASAPVENCDDVAAVEEPGA